ncbi:MAG: hypothetical protein CMO36_02450 [Verrucomicrobiaceae bacterium]|nr:hypothetical protein [Verrucomicrobiaceae bacterium]|tara:strand:- start:1162 stop:1674 length:513 start_codon:yes stop_codon:yes gene_type:complete
MKTVSPNLPNPITSDTSKQNSGLAGPGWICLHRNLRKHWVYQNPVYLKIWIEFLLLANFDRRESVINNRVVVLKKGQFIFGRKEFSKRLGVTEHQIRRFITNAITTNMVHKVNRHKYSIITITNYDIYQERRQQSATKTPGKRHESTTSKQVNKYKSRNRNISAPKDMGI